MSYKIGKVSREVGMTIKRIRDYEREGLIKPRRKMPGNQRRYDEFDIRLIKQIKHLIHDRGLTISGIIHLLKTAPCWTVLQCSDPEICPAYKNPHQRCWNIKTHLKVAPECMGNCDRCPIYLVRNYEIQPLFEKSPN